MRSAQRLLVFRWRRPGSLPLPVVLAPGPLGPRPGAGLLGGELDVPVVETDGPQQQEEDERDDEAEASLVLVDEAVTVVIVVGVPTPVENNHTKRTCEEQYNEQPGGSKRK